MAAFFALFFSLILGNAALWLFSISNNGQKGADSARNDSNASAKIYPLDLSDSEYKKAI